MTATITCDDAIEETPQCPADVVADHGSGPPTAVLVYLDPRALAANPANVRGSLGDLGPLTASIAAVGVLEPLVVVPDGEGGHRIVAGHRRTAAAIQADQALVPCLVRPDLATADNTAQLVAMVVENIHRQNLSGVDEARAYGQLALTGLSAAKIAKHVGLKPAHVKKGLAVAGSELAVAAGERYALTLDQAAVLAEFDGDDEAVKTLVVTAKQNPGQWDHLVSRLRQDRKAAAAHTAAIQALRDAGVTVIDQPNYRGAARLGDLADADGNVLSEQGHASCPGHAAVVWNPERIGYYCTDPATYSHKSRWGDSSPKPAATVNGKMTEDAKAARREVIENNKAWRAAEPVRRSYLVELLARKTPPKGTLRYAVAQVLSAPERVGDGKEELLASLLGKPAPKGYSRSLGAAAADATTDARLPLLLLAQVAADREQAMNEFTWRRRDHTAARWFAFLASTGYTLAPIEQKVVDDAVGVDSDDVDDADQDHGERCDAEYHVDEAAEEE